MTDRERLIELLEDTLHEWESDVSVQTLTEIAEHLIENGVIVPPCKVGDICWFIRSNKIIKTTIEKIVLKEKGLYLKLSCNSLYETTCRSIGKTVFFTYEEAEKTLKTQKGY